MNNAPNANFRSLRSVAFIWRLNKSNVLIAHLSCRSVAFRAKCTRAFDSAANRHDSAKSRSRRFLSPALHMKYRCIESETTNTDRSHTLFAFIASRKTRRVREKAETGRAGNRKENKLHCVCIKKDICLLWNRALKFSINFFSLSGRRAVLVALVSFDQVKGDRRTNVFARKSLS